MAKVKDQLAGLPGITSGSATVLSDEFALNPNAISLFDVEYMMAQPFHVERIHGCQGHLVLSEDGSVLNSGGDLVNDEATAEKLTKLAYLASKVQISDDKRETFKKISVIWDNFMYVITVSNHKIYIIKRQFTPNEPVTA